MKHHEIQSIYYKHMPILRKLADIPVTYPLKIKDLNLERKDILRGYRDRDICGFKGSLIDFFCWLSTMSLSFHIALGYSRIKSLNSFLDVALMVHPYDLSNTMRLSFKNINYLLDGIKQMMVEYREHIKNADDISDEELKELVKAFGEYASKKIKLRWEI